MSYLAYREKTAENVTVRRYRVDSSSYELTSPAVSCLSFLAVLRTDQTKTAMSLLPDSSAPRNSSPPLQ